MQYSMKNEGLTFNDLPEAMTTILRKVENMENELSGLRKDLNNCHQTTENAKHILMTTDEACDFLSIPKTTMYVYARSKNIPCVKKGKKYMFFLDELLEWIESGRRAKTPQPTIDDINAILGKRIRTKK